MGKRESFPKLFLVQRLLLTSLEGGKCSVSGPKLFALF